MSTLVHLLRLPPLLAALLVPAAQDEGADARVYRFQNDADLGVLEVVAGSWIASSSGLTCTTKGANDEVLLKEELPGWRRITLDLLASREAGVVLLGGSAEVRFAIDKADGVVEVLRDGEVQETLKGPVAPGRELFRLSLAQDGGRITAQAGDTAPVALDVGLDARVLTRVGLFSDRSQSTFYRLVVGGVGAAPAESGEEELAPAAVLLAEAEEHAAAGRFARAVSTYRALARDFPDTPEGKTAARRSQGSAYLGAMDLVRHGPSANRVDVVFMGDGYTLDHLDTFARLAEDMPPYFDKDPVFHEYFAYLDFTAALLVSAEDGVDEYGREYDTALDGHRTGTIQGHVGVSRSRVMQMLDEMPEHDGLAVVFVRTGNLGTGGSGVACIGGRNPGTMIHEFAHAFVGLGDEYSQTIRHGGLVGTAPNVSATDDPDKVPWKHWLDAHVPGIGIYEGASGRAQGAWKPTSRNCIMDNGKFFCPVCRETLVLGIYRHVDPIDGETPPAMSLGDADSRRVGDEMTFTVEVLQPASHDLEVAWYVLPVQLAPRSADPWEGGPAGRDRRNRGPLPAIDTPPVELVQHKRRSSHTFTLEAKDFAPGRYRVVCRVRDDTRLRDERFPWVLADPDGLLESERAWWVEVVR